MVKMSQKCKDALVNEFEFNQRELLQIEEFMNGHNNMTARDILDSLMKDEKLDIRQKVVISYVIGDSVGHTERPRITDSPIGIIEYDDIQYGG